MQYYFKDEIHRNNIQRIEKSNYKTNVLKLLMIFVFLKNNYNIQHQLLLHLEYFLVGL